MYVMRLISPRRAPRKERKGKETRCVVPATEIKNKRKTGEEREGEKRNASKKRCIKKLSKSAARAAAPQFRLPLPTRPHPHQWNCFQCCRAASAPEESPSGCLLAVSLQSRPGNKISATWPSNMQQQTGGNTSREAGSRQHVQQDDDLLA